jgi:hypothetical protein
MRQFNNSNEEFFIFKERFLKRWIRLKDIIESNTEISDKGFDELASEWKIFWPKANHMTGWKDMEKFSSMNLTQFYDEREFDEDTFRRYFNYFLLMGGKRKGKTTFVLDMSIEMSDDGDNENSSMENLWGFDDDDEEETPSEEYDETLTSFMDPFGDADWFKEPKESHNDFGYEDEDEEKLFKKEFGTLWTPERPPNWYMKDPVFDIPVEETGWSELDEVIQIVEPFLEKSGRSILLLDVKETKEVLNEDPSEQRDNFLERILDKYYGFIYYLDAQYDIDFNQDIFSIGGESIFKLDFHYDTSQEVYKDFLKKKVLFPQVYVDTMTFPVIWIGKSPIKRAAFVKLKQFCARKNMESHTKYEVTLMDND